MERETQDEILIDLPELLALYLRKGFWIIGISILFALFFTGFRILKEKESISLSTNSILNGASSEEEKGKLEEEMQKDKYVLKSRKKEGKNAQAAAVVTDHKTGEIVAAVGGLRRPNNND